MLSVRMRPPWLPLLAAIALAGCDAEGDPDAGSDAGSVEGDAGLPPSAAGLCDPGADPGPFPSPDAWSNRGPGGPTVTFEEADLFANCAFLDGGEGDTTDHHNLVTMFDGYLLMPYGPEFGGGGLAFFEIDEPCSPSRVGAGYSETYRESHSVGISTRDGAWAVVDQLSLALFRGRGGIQFWDISDPTAPTHAVDLELPDFLYPDSYSFLSVSVFWQDPYVYVGGAQNGVWIVDAADPRRPSVLGTHTFEPPMTVGNVQALGNLLVVTGLEDTRTVLLDISVPDDPQPIPGGDFVVTSLDGREREPYFTTFVGGRIYYANKEGGGGFVVWDARDPENPAYLGEHISDGNSGYVYVQDDHVFVGESRFAAIYDATDMGAITEVARLDLEGDLDTLVPIGNVAVLACDEEANPDQGSAIAPWRTEPDATPPRLTFAWPPDGATGLRTSSRFGVGFSEFVDVRSAHAGSVRLYRSDAASPDAGRVDAIVSAQETLVNVHPRCPLEPNTSYTLEVVAGGVADFNGNVVGETTTLTFTTGPE